MNWVLSNFNCHQKISNCRHSTLKRALELIRHQKEVARDVTVQKVITKMTTICLNDKGHYSSNEEQTLLQVVKDLLGVLLWKGYRSLES